MAWRFLFTISGILLPLLTLTYAYYRHKLNYFERRGIPHLTADKLSSLKGNTKQRLRSIYQQFKDKTPIVGLYLQAHTATPTILLLDLKLIKRVLIDDFTNFSERLSDGSLNNDLLHTLEHSKWQVMRRKLTPCFWSAKMNLIFPNVRAAAEGTMAQMINIFEGDTLDLKMFSTEYVINALQSCVFGAELTDNYLANESAQALRMRINELCSATSHESQQTRFAFVVDSLMTNLYGAQCTHAQATTRQASEQLKNEVRAALEERRKARKEQRNDIMQIFIELLAEKGEDEVITNANEHEKGEAVVSDATQLIAQTLNTLITGFANSAKVLLCCLRELALNKETQQKLRADIERLIAQLVENVNPCTVSADPTYLIGFVCNRLFNDVRRRSPYRRNQNHFDFLRKNVAAHRSHGCKVEWLPVEHF